ncbi:MAG: hypothetical protein Q8Q42_00460 [Nanoarchaeota archaeon]|nr:hypothetical protein [Nanoarchaeota archaeon]
MARREGMEKVCQALKVDGAIRFDKPKSGIEVLVTDIQSKSGDRIGSFEVFKRGSHRVNDALSGKFKLNPGDGINLGGGIIIKALRRTIFGQGIYILCKYPKSYRVTHIIYS